MRLIDADAFYESYCTSFEGNVPEGEMDRMAYAIASQTTVEAEPVKHGEWNIIECDKENGRVVVECECGAVFKLSMFEFGLCYNYCPNCGARMDGKKIATDCTICGHTNCVSDSVCKICGVKYAE